jgi:phage baseplate assembly protein W
MATFIGFNTIDQIRKFTLTDADLIKRDFLNALNINKGEVPGRPEYGTTIWSFIFNNQSIETEQAMLAELQRVAAQDPRLYLDQVEFYPFNNGIRIEVLLQIVPSTTAERLTIFFDQQAQRARLTS